MRGAGRRTARAVRRRRAPGPLRFVGALLDLAKVQLPHPAQDTDPAALTARIEGPSATEAAARGLSLLSREGIEVAGFALGQPSLDEAFLALTGQPAAPSTKNEKPT
jgi:ABC-2 type transport system ATP-binding protein